MKHARHSAHGFEALGDRVACLETSQVYWGAELLPTDCRLWRRSGSARLQRTLSLAQAGGPGLDPDRYKACGCDGVDGVNGVAMRC